MGRIVVTTLGTLGDLYPMIAIALELRQIGHDVVFVTHQVYQSKIEAFIGQCQPDWPANLAITGFTFAAKAMEIGRIIQAEDGVGDACDAIEQQFAVA